MSDKELRDKLLNLDEEDFLLLLYLTLSSIAINLLAKQNKHHSDFEWSLVLAIAKDILKDMSEEEIEISLLEARSKFFDNINNLTNSPSPKVLLKHRKEIEAELINWKKLGK